MEPAAHVSRDTMVRIPRLIGSDNTLNARLCDIARAKHIMLELKYTFKSRLTNDGEDWHPE